MESESMRLEREAEEARWQLSGTLDELRCRMTAGQVVDQVIDYTRDGSAAQFLRNLRHEVPEHPIPLVLIGIGIVWLLAASSRASRAAIGNAADTVVRKADDLAPATGAVLSRTGQSERQTAARPADRAKVVAVTTLDRSKRPLACASEDAAGTISSGRLVVASVTHQMDDHADERR
jgi:hypothetical protein